MHQGQHGCGKQMAYMLLTALKRRTRSDALIMTLSFSVSGPLPTMAILRTSAGANAWHMAAWDPKGQLTGPAAKEAFQSMAGSVSPYSCRMRCCLLAGLCSCSHFRQMRSQQVCGQTTLGCMSALSSHVNAPLLSACSATSAWPPTCFCEHGIFMGDFVIFCGQCRPEITGRCHVCLPGRCSKSLPLHPPQLLQRIPNCGSEQMNASGACLWRDLETQKPPG